MIPNWLVVDGGYVTKIEATERVEDIINRYEEARLSNPEEYQHGIRVNVDEHTVKCLKRLLREAWARR